MIYAVSDIHGYYDKYQKLLKKISFGPDDTLLASLPVTESASR